MSPEQILTKAYWQAKFARQTPRNIPIREIRRTVEIPITRLKPDPIVPDGQFHTVETIRNVVCEHFGIDLVDIVSQRRTGSINRPRQIIMYLSRTYTPQSFPIIGRMLGNRDHTTVLHGFHKIKSALECGDNDLHEHVEQIKAKLGLT